MELLSSSTKHGTYAAVPVEPVAAEVLPRRSELECDCSGQAWGEYCYFLIIQRIYAVYLASALHFSEALG